jgi:hypothetical protein
MSFNMGICRSPDNTALLVHIRKVESSCKLRTRGNTSGLANHERSTDTATVPYWDSPAKEAAPESACRFPSRNVLTRLAWEMKLFPRSGASASSSRSF